MYYDFNYTSPPRPCPTCGHCPTCGRPQYPFSPYPGIPPQDIGGTKITWSDNSFTVKDDGTTVSRNLI